MPTLLTTICVLARKFAKTVIISMLLLHSHEQCQINSNQANSTAMDLHTTIIATLQ